MGYKMTTVSLTELRKNLDSYIKQTKEGDVVITRYGSVIAKLISTVNSATSSAKGSVEATEEDDSDSPDTLA